MTEFVVSNVTLLDGAVELNFMRVPDDVRNDGKLIAARSFTVADDHPAYHGEIAELRELVVGLVRDLYEDFDDAPVTAMDGPGDDGEEDDDDDDRGMGE